jgi:flagellin
MSEVTLTQSTRVNLLALKKNTALIEQTSLRLSTGKRVNAPAENVRAFVLAKALTDQAGDLLSVKGPIGQSLSAVGGALDGIDTITRLVEQLKATASGATDRTAAERAEQAASFDRLRAQLDGIAADINYGGVNLLAASPDSLTVTFDNTSGSSLTIEGVASDSQALGIGDGAVTFNNFATDADIQAAIDALDAAITTLRQTASGLGSNASVLNTRLDFTQALVHTFETGATKLVGVDLNGEAANLLSPNIARQLSIASLNIANQSQQAILQLF